MKIDIHELDQVTQLRVRDPEMYFFDRIEKQLANHQEVTLENKMETFETPIINYRHKGIDFSLLFDEQEDETFIAVPKPQEYQEIVKLFQEIQ